MIRGLLLEQKWLKNVIIFGDLWRDDHLWGSDSIVSQVLMKHETESKTHSMGYSAAYPTGRERIFFSRSWKPYKRAVLGVDEVQISHASGGVLFAKGFTLPEIHGKRGGKCLKGARAARRMQCSISAR